MLSIFEVLEIAVSSFIIACIRYSSASQEGNSPPFCNQLRCELMSLNIFLSITFNFIAKSEEETIHLMHKQDY